MNGKRLTRSNNRVIGGVCAGIAEWLGWDIALVRILYLVLSILSAAFPGILVYIILWIVIPPEDTYYY
jgi:phage shock protein PspC (stress-responsive transcriptional regulator)